MNWPALLGDQAAPTGNDKCGWPAGLFDSKLNKVYPLIKHKKMLGGAALNGLIPTGLPGKFKRTLLRHLRVSRGLRPRSNGFFHPRYPKTFYRNFSSLIRPRRVQIPIWHRTNARPFVSGTRGSKLKHINRVASGNQRGNWR